jgi:transposase
VDAPGHIVGPAELRQHQFAEAKRLHAEGWSYRRIAGEIQLDRRTVQKYVQAEQLPRRVLPQNSSSVTPYLPLVQQRWLAGERDGAQMLVALQQQGYRGSLASVYRALKAFRSGDGRRSSGNAMTERVPTRSPRQAMWMLVRDLKDLSDEDSAYRAALCAHDQVIAEAATLGQRFLEIIRERQADALASWLDDAEASGIKEMMRLAQGLRRDHSAVSAALTTEWSNAQTEGQVNRLKMIKRTMFGRASFELLRNRVLHTP